MAFQPPGPETCREAIGDRSSLSGDLRQAFEPGTDFEPIPAPGPRDWLAVHRELGQTFGQFKDSRPIRPDTRRRKIYLRPLGEFPSGPSPSLDLLEQYAAVYFALETETLPAVHHGNFTARINRLTHNRQILTTDVLRFLMTKLPCDAFCILAITMEDLYPEPAWNFVFGQASLRERVAVFSFARYDATFYARELTTDYHTVLLRRSCKVLAHETAHMFGLAHCIFFKCAMNGSNHLDESDCRPMHLCPVCLRKLQFSVGFDVAQRYEKLAQFYQAAGFADEARWTRNRLRIFGHENRAHR